VTVVVETSVTIELDPPTVWSAIEPIERHVDWMADAESITFVGEQRRGVGTTFDCITRIGPLRTTDRMTVTRWDPGVAMGIEHRGAVTGVGELRLEPVGAGTRLSWREELHLPWWFGGRVGEQIARPVLRRVWQANLRRLRALTLPGT
jgi:hypothetical protein